MAQGSHNTPTSETYDIETLELLQDFRDQMRCQICNDRPPPSHAEKMLCDWVTGTMPIMVVVTQPGVTPSPSDIYLFCKECDKLHHIQCVLASGDFGLELPHAMVASLCSMENSPLWRCRYCVT